MNGFQGVCAFPITPADADGRVDTDALRRLLGRLTGAGVSSIGVLGSTGSYAYLERAERRRAIEAAVEQVARRVPVLVGIGALRTDDAVRLGQDAKAAGADAVLLAPVSYTPLTDEEVFTHFETVARAVALPLCVYDNPATTHFTFGTGLLARLSRVPGIAALKTPAPAAGLVRDHLGTLRAAVGDGFPVGCSVDAHATEAMLAGAAAWYSVVAGLFPDPCLRILASVRDGDADAARRLDARLKPLWDLFGEFGSLRVVHAAANLLGLCATHPPRPILPLGDAARRRIAGVLEALGLS